MKQGPLRSCAAPGGEGSGGNWSAGGIPERKNLKRNTKNLKKPRGGGGVSKLDTAASFR